MIKIIIFMLFIFSGLFASQIQNEPFVKEKDGVLEIYAEAPSDLKEKFDDNGSWYSGVVYKQNNLYRFELQEALKKASQESLRRGFKYFAIVNKEINNLQGFPINNYEDLKNYCFAGQGNMNHGTDFSAGGKSAVRYRGIFRDNGIFLKIIPMNESHQYFLWNAEEVMKEL